MKAKRTVRWSITIVVLLVLQEVLLRWMFPIGELSNFDRSLYMERKPNTELPFQYHTPWMWQSQPDTAFEFVSEMNSYGFRGPDWTVQQTDGIERVLFVGDSFVEGIMAVEDETIPAAFQREFADGAVEVLNGGMMGTGIASYLGLVADAVPIFQPDVLYLVMYANDLPPASNQAPETRMEPEFRSAWTPRAVALIQAALDGKPVPPVWKAPANYLPDSANASYPWKGRDADLRNSVAPELFQHVVDGTVNPFKVYQAKRQEPKLKQPLELHNMFGFLKYYQETYGTKMVVVYLPSREQVTDFYWPYERAFCTGCPESFSMTGQEYTLHQQQLKAAALQAGLPFIDFTPMLRDQEQRGNHLYWNYDEHMRGAGYQFVGKLLGRVHQQQFR